MLTLFSSAPPKTIEEALRKHCGCRPYCILNASSVHAGLTCPDHTIPTLAARYHGC